MKKREPLIYRTEEEILALLKQKVPKRTVREFDEILFIEFVSVTGGVAAGAMLAAFLDKVALVPGLLILLPGFLAMRGNISGSLAGRISVALHLGLLKKGKHHPSILPANTVAAFVLGVLASLFLGIVAYAGMFWFFNANTPDIMLVALIAGIVSNLIMIPLTTRTTIWLYRHGHDPDNIMGPYITTVGDIVSIASLIIAILVV